MTVLLFKKKSFFDNAGGVSGGQMLNFTFRTIGSRIPCQCPPLRMQFTKIDL